MMEEYIIIFFNISLYPFIELRFEMETVVYKEAPGPSGSSGKCLCP